MHHIHQKPNLPQSCQTCYADWKFFLPRLPCWPQDKCSLLLPDFGGTRGAEGAARDFLCQALKIQKPDSPSPMAAPRPSCWCSRSELPRVRKGSLKTKAIYLSFLPPVILWFWPRKEGKSIRPTLGISGFLSKFTSSCARNGLSGLPSRAAGPSWASQGGWWLHAWNAIAR